MSQCGDQTVLIMADGRRWIETVREARERGEEILTLDMCDQSVFVTVVDFASGAVRRLGTPVQDGTVLPRPSAHGIGEVIRAQESLQDRVAWDPADHPTRVVRGKGVFRFPLGPVRGDVAESLLYRLSVMGDEILRLDLKAGFKSRHIVEQARGLGLLQALWFVERMTGTSTVAHAWAFSQAVEDALGWRVDRQAALDRTVLAELERAASHSGDLAALAASTGLSVPQMSYLHLKERILRMMGTLTGHRYGRGAIRPGGIAVPPVSASDLMRAADQIGEIRSMSRNVVEALEHTPSFLDRLEGTGAIPADTVRFVRPVGPVGRAAGRNVDVRRDRPYGAYADVAFLVPLYREADARARFRVKVRELDASLAILTRLLPDWGPSLVSTEFGEGSGWGLGLVEAPRGLLAYVAAMSDPPFTVRDLAVATPSARNWYTVPGAVQNHNILQDWPIIEASFNLSVAGWDQ